MTAAQAEKQQQRGGTRTVLLLSLPKLQADKCDYADSIHHNSYHAPSLLLEYHPSRDV